MLQNPDGAGANGQPPAEDDDLLSSEEWIAFATDNRLSDRELEAVVLVCRDLGRKEIAKRLGLSAGSLNTYMNRLHRKLCVETRVGLVLKVVRWALAARGSCPGAIG
jgi:DNA-binding CsgD family transcriptional regulator